MSDGPSPPGRWRDYDLVVVGGGAGGMAAARAGARRRARTLLVQDGPIGGDCTFTGCVPSKAVIAAAARGDGFDAAMASARRAVSAVAAAEDDGVMAREGIEVRHGRARFRSSRCLEIEGDRVSAPRIVVATGARPAVAPIPGLDQIAYLTNESVFDLAALPPRLAVLGGGAIGCELAQAFARLGSQVTLVEALDRLVAKEEPEASALLGQVLASEGIDVRVGQRVDRVEPAGGGTALLHAGAAAVEADAVLVALGRRPVTEGLDPQAAGVELDERGFVVTDDSMATTAPGIWAVGDVAGKLQFTHAADEMGRIAVANALARGPARLRTRRFRAEWTPWVTFTRPEVARVGLTEAEAALQGARVAYLPMTEVDRAVAEGDTRGFVKLLAGPRPFTSNLGGGRLLGATVVCPRAGEMIHEVSVAMRAGAFSARLAVATHAYPTWSAAIQQAAAQLFMVVGGRCARPARTDVSVGVSVD